MISRIAKVFIGFAVLSVELFSCAGGFEVTFVNDEYYNFLNPQMVNVSSDNRMYDLGTYSPKSSVAVYNARHSSFSKISKNENIKEWHKYLSTMPLSSRLSAKDIELIFYGKENAYNSTTISQNAKPYISKLNSDLKQYIAFLDMQMPVANQSYDTKTPRNTKSIIDKALGLYNTTNDKFLKNRYGFLIMRLYHFTRDYKSELDFYNKNSATLNSNWLTKEWTGALRAGAMKNLDMRLEANEAYADIFQNNKTNPFIGFYDFGITDDNMWTKQLSRAKSTDDKARLYFLRAMEWKNEPIYELENMANIAPDSIWFDRLSYMIMQSLQNQRYSIGESQSLRGDNPDPELQQKAYDSQSAYYKKILNSQKNKSFFTLYSLLYLDALSRKPIDSNKLAELKSASNAKMDKYVELITYLYELNAFSSQNMEKQDSFYNNLKPLLAKLDTKERTSLLRYTALNIATLYPKDSIQKKLALNYASDNPEGLGYLLQNSDGNMVEDYQNSKKTFLDNEIFHAQSQDKDSENRLLSTLFMQKNDFVKAKTYALHVKTENIFAFNPFNVSLSGNNRKPIKGEYSLIKFIDTMITLQNKIKSNSATPMDHYLYANGLYNKSWFGNIPTSSMYYRSIYISREDFKYRAFSLSLAANEYKIALKTTTDNELKAKISYQLLKIDFNNALVVEANRDKYGFYHSTENFDETAKTLLSKHKTFRDEAKAYKQNYNNTQYGKDIIRQCATFKFL